ncbi:helix-turn-helix transcriptional regulator [Actinomadura barringtoniae]|uniref:Helix-turn-helix transcriptional regulator n=1 Tax=Actinomadura barringtoniae TaxID=1427535 RepID=A0A939PAA5_9ACTN|nr:helix-turn-helix transcriptional regulator [Actinomadura barringtoniae]MBO2446298.1 helix-turn-helix transcriptional regulator [Actinomadura barringtoniae]
MLPDRRNAKTSCSPREIEVLRRVAEGMTDDQIARTLGISRRTVRTHLERIFKKHGLHSRAAAVGILRNDQW